MGIFTLSTEKWNGKHLWEQDTGRNKLFYNKGDLYNHCMDRLTTMKKNHVFTYVFRVESLQFMFMILINKLKKILKYQMFIYHIFLNLQ